MRVIAVISVVVFLVMGASLHSKKSEFHEMPVQEVLLLLGDEKPAHYIEHPDQEKQRLGYELVHYGRADLPEGGKSKYISKYYVCTDCHNQKREDPVLTESNPETRLIYAQENNLKFLQSTTFWGMANRETWYNDDYVLKYGDLVKPANKSLAEATQLCARECSSGRYLEDWELEAILQYYWTIDLKISDLSLNKDEVEYLQKALDNRSDQNEAVDFLKSRYSLASPATFITEYKNDLSPNLEGNVERGEMIWDLSCKTCHREYGPSQLIFEDSKYTFRKFKRHQSKNSNFNLHNIIRHGTYAEPGHLQYMPLYTLERMSHQQQADLRAFLIDKAE